MVKNVIQEKVKQLIQIKANQNENYLNPKEVLITDFLIETVKFNYENAKWEEDGD